MLRVGLTGNLGSGKSTVAALFAARGAKVLSSDAIGRDLMQAGQAVFDQMVAKFGPTVLRPDGALDRTVLARIAFAEGRVEELNAIVHPAVIAEQVTRMAEIFAVTPDAVVMVESALLFETKFGTTGEAGDGRRKRFEQILLVTASNSEKIARFIHRQASSGSASDKEIEKLKAEARRRLSLQIPDSVKAGWCDHVIANDGSLDHLEAQVEMLWPTLRAASERSPAPESSATSLQ